MEITKTQQRDISAEALKQELGNRRPMSYWDKLAKDPLVTPREYVEKRAWLKKEGAQKRHGKLTDIEEELLAQAAKHRGGLYLDVVDFLDYEAVKPAVKLAELGYFKEVPTKDSRLHYQLTEKGWHNIPIGRYGLHDMNAAWHCRKFERMRKLKV